ncbi:MAG TPA: chemotaxis protein CheB [Gemmatimonadales bacterium]|nr:chemotaxis protein CheB [Gemmatimonadales bacterium]
MTGHDIVVVGFSAGGIDPLQQLVAGLPADFPASIFVVHHFPAMSVSVLPDILGRAGSLPASQPEDGEHFKPGHIYVARPDYHLLLRAKHVRLTRGPKEQGHRPAVDPLFRTAAREFGPRVIGVILSGTLDDGSAGLVAIKDAGGLAVVQDPSDAAYPGMPLNALQHVKVDHVASAAELGKVLDRLARLPAPPAPAQGGIPRFDEIDPADPEPAVVGTAGLRATPPPGQPSSIVCPDCGGVLWESQSGDLLHFRCHVGHAYSAETLLAKQSTALEGALWTAIRALEEKADIARRLADRSRHRGMKRALGQFENVAMEAERGSNVIRESLLKGAVRTAIEEPAELDLDNAVDLLSGTDAR